MWSLTPEEVPQLEGPNAGEFVGKLAGTVLMPLVGGSIQNVERLEQVVASRAELVANTASKRGIAEFQGLEVRAIRDLSHIDEGTLRAMQQYGFAAKDAKGNSLVLHHHQQNPTGPIIEIPAANHSIGNVRQHPFGNAKGAGLTPEERVQFNQWRTDYWKWRAGEELNMRSF